MISLNSFATYFTRESCKTREQEGTHECAPFTETGIFVSRKFQVPPVNWRLTLCSVALREKIFDDTDGPNTPLRRIMCVEPVRDLVIISTVS